ncbi:ThiF family adenylyltransferase [Microbacterium sp. G2-8]|uniref:ThiF family adenylyltransferase n=1 Tax=Microbacterium sp. G2-8 TaxID=2842454 RepID=UPI001C8A60FD|nr:ThiF family adenylyltransferase [Microbacterium sp. G2-8]
MALPPLVDPVAQLTPAEAARTARHHVLFPLGEEGQRRLQAAHVAIVGAGGLGSPALLALAAAGVGRLTVIDDDDVDASNLQRQVMHRTRDIGRAKVDSAVRAGHDLAPECDVVAVRERLTADNAGRILRGADVVIDGSDTFATREIVDAACAAIGVPLVWGVVQEFHAQVTVFWADPPAGAPATRLSDLHPAGAVGNVPTCAEVGVLGALVMQVGSLMATQAILLVAGIGDPLVGRIALVDALRSTTREVPFRASSPATPPPIPRTVPTEVTDAELRGALIRTLVIDVREPSERRDGVIAGSVAIPVAEVLADPSAAAARVRDAADGRDVVTVCAAGVRSARATAALAGAGLTSRSLTGGMRTWSGAVVAPDEGGRA